jgi:hypothetical protein
MNDVETKRPARVFLSYSKSDQAAAARIAEVLKQTGMHAWFAGWELGPGDSLREHIGSAASSSDCIVVLLSRAAVESPWVKKDITLALSRELEDRAIRLIPVLLEDCEIPASLADRQWIDMRQNREVGIRGVIDQIDAVTSVQLSGLTPQAFETLVGDLLVKLGFSVEEQAHSGRDPGFDFKAVYKSRDPFGVEMTQTWLAQAKFYRNSRVSVGTLRDAVGVLTDWPEATKALIVTSGNITSEARSFLAESKFGSRIRVIGGAELTTLIAQYPDLINLHFHSGGSRG